MSRCDWIACERTGRWAAALRIAIERQFSASSPPPRLYEVRSLDDLSTRLDERPESLALVEARRNNLADVLAWLSAADRRWPHAKCIALLDSELSAVALRHDVVDSLREAGAATIAYSPRNLNDVVQIGERHSAAAAARHVAALAELSVSERAWALLPWQGD